MLPEAIRREIGQHFVLGYHGHDVSDDIKSLIQTYFVGNVIMMKRNLQTLAKEAGHEQPLLIGTDQENVTYAATGAQLKLLGVNWAYSPVADVNSDMRNPVIGVRSFGDDPVQVGKYVIASAKGLISSNVAPSAKHFPGHGDTHVDSHLALPKIMKTKAQIDKDELVPFRMLIESDLKPTDSTIMIGHMALPLVTGSDEPSSLSKKIVTDILRKELQFDGVVVTDCLEMDAIADPACGGCGVEEGSVRALEAGNDVIMICHTMDRQVGALQKTYEAIESGRMKVEDLQQSGVRIRDMKTRYLGSWDDVLKDLQDPGFSDKWSKAKADSVQDIETAYANSIALLQPGAPGVLPLQADATKKTLLFTPELESLNKAVDDAEGVLRGKGGEVRNTVGASFLALAAAISQRTKSEHIVVDWPSISNVVFVLRNANTATWQLERLKIVVEEAKSSGVKLVIMSSCTPYDLLGVSGLESYPCLATFEFTPPAFAAATRVLFGESAAQGEPPVKFSS
ncbi:glycoside hydrolase superfamily [Mucidula mucida]|nr:glycoside hydrolase superfamily [Mucidula mucida]